MMLERFKAAHLSQIVLQDSQAYLRDYVDDDYAHALESAGPAYTIRSVVGAMVFCGGFIETHDGAHLWSFISPLGRERLITLHPYVQRALEVHPYAQLTATIEADFEPGAQWLAMLGFEAVERLCGYGPDGRDHVLYQREGI